MHVWRERVVVVGSIDGRQGPAGLVRPEPRPKGPTMITVIQKYLAFCHLLAVSEKSGGSSNSFRPLQHHW